MQDSIRLVCPDCDAVHRVKSITLGKLYRCKKCKAGLITMSPAKLVCPSCTAETPPTHVEVSRLITCEECDEAPLMRVAFPEMQRSVHEMETTAQTLVDDESVPPLVADSIGVHGGRADVEADTAPSADRTGNAPLHNQEQDAEAYNDLPPGTSISTPTETPSQTRPRYRQEEPVRLGRDPHDQTQEQEEETSSLPALQRGLHEDRAVAALRQVFEDVQRPYLNEIQRERWSISLWIPLLCLLPLAAGIGLLFSMLDDTRNQLTRALSTNERQQEWLESELAFRDKQIIQLQTDLEQYYLTIQKLKAENEEILKENERIQRIRDQLPRLPR